MNIKELYEQKTKLLPVKAVHITDIVEEYLEEPDCPMMCDIKNIVIDPDFDDGDGKVWYKLYLDFSPYEDYNKSVAIPALSLAVITLYPAASIIFFGTLYSIGWNPLNAMTSSIACIISPYCFYVLQHRRVFIAIEISTIRISVLLLTNFNRNQ